MNRASVTLLAIFLGLSALVVVVFGQTLSFQFVNYDDSAYVYQNSHINSGLSWQNMRWAFTHVHSANWHPLTSISHMLDCQIFGLRSGGHHATNVLLHLLTTLLLFQFLRLSTGQLWRAAIAAALFTIHPLRAESVAWISERKDVLSGFFFVVTLLAYLRYTRRFGLGRYFLVVLSLAAGLMAKPMLVTTPIVLLLLDFWPLRRGDGIDRKVAAPDARAPGEHSAGSASFGKQWLILEKAPLFLLVGGSIAATLLAQRFALGTTDNLPLAWRVNNALVSYFNYLRQIFWPVDLIPFYPHPESHLAGHQVTVAALALVLLTLLAFLLRRRQPWLLAGWLWYVVMLLPVIGIIQVGLQARADRYTYLPQIGVIIAVVWTVSYHLKSRIVCSILAMAAIGSSAVLAYRQASHWRNTEALWSYTLTKSPENDVALTGLGGIELVRGGRAEAISHYERAVELRPGNGAAQHGLALALWQERKVDAAIEHWQKSLAAQPDNNEARNYLGTALASIGKEEEAAPQWQAALEFDRDDGNAANNLAWMLATAQNPSLRNPEEAVRLAKHATALPGGENVVVYRTLAAAYAEAGEFDLALSSVQHAIELARRSNNNAQIEELERLRDLFRSGKPIRGK